MCGVPQGSVLFLALFSVYTAEKVSTKYRNITVKAQADDIIIHSYNQNAQRALNSAEYACNDIPRKHLILNMAVNTAKTDCAIFLFQKGKKKMPSSLKIDENIIQPYKKLEYRGITLDRHLRFTAHFRQALSPACITQAVPSSHTRLCFCMGIQSLHNWLRLQLKYFSPTKTVS